MFFLSIYTRNWQIACYVRDPLNVNHTNVIIYIQIYRLFKNKYILLKKY